MWDHQVRVMFGFGFPGAEILGPGPSRAVEGAAASCTGKSTKKIAKMDGIPGLYMVISEVE